ncbi:MAG: MFS transporter [Flavobacteriales bacterium]|nr:MFS transporter [Flavobacteriales bacterium]
MKNISKTVWILSWVSLFADTASEMLYPVMPVYLKTIGFSMLLIGILEGIAEATAGLSKGYFGKLSDNTGKRTPFVQLGYTLSAISKPLIVLFAYPLWVFFARTLDRLGKGIRTAARDALLSEESTPQTKGKVFGLHRSMDTLGAVIGPSLALIYLHFYPQNYVTLFYIAFIPGIAAVITSLLLKDKKILQNKFYQKTSFFSFFQYWKVSSLNYKKVVIGLLLFSIFNSSDVFLLLKAKESGISDSLLIGIYIFYNLIYALFAFPLGIIADKTGLKKIFLFGLILFAIVYAGMAFNELPYMFYILFFMYGIYAASTESISKAWITIITDKKDTATAIGMFSSLQSIATLAASSLTGLIWHFWGAETALLISAGGTILVIIFFLFFVNNSK